MTARKPAPRPGRSRTRDLHAPAAAPPVPKAQRAPARIVRPAEAPRYPVSPPPASQVPVLIRDALEKRSRAGLPSDATTAWRVVHDRWDQLSGLVVEAWGTLAVVRVRSEAWLDSPYRSAVRDTLLDAGFQTLHYIIDEDSRSVERKAGDLEEGINRALAEAGFGAPIEPFVVRESGLAFEINARDGFSQGLYTDMRTVRDDLRKRWKNKRILNLFAYTCGFGVMLAGRNQVTNVDVSARHLEWGKRNYALNGLPTDSGFVARDAFEFLEKAVRRGERWDAVILDPPAYSRGKAGKAREFSIRRDLGGLVEQALDVLTDNGEAFVSTNLADLAPEAFRKLIIGIALDRDTRMLQQWKPQPDYPAPPSDYHLKTVLLRRTTAAVPPTT
jgi:23S rRNA (cytosine1962-C5)-methyltransferase